MELKDLTLPQKVLCIKDYVNGRLRIRKGSYWKLIEYEEHCDTAHGHPRYMVQHPQFPPVFFNLSDKEYREKYGGMCFDDYFQICDNNKTLTLMMKIVKPKGVNPHRSFVFTDSKKPRLPRKTKKWYKNLFAQNMGFNPKELRWQFINFANCTFGI